MRRNFRVTVKDGNNQDETWDFYTTTGNAPNNSIYLFNDGDAPSMGSQAEIEEKVERGDFEEV